MQPIGSPIKIPSKAVLINVVGALMCGSGVHGLVADDRATRMHWSLAILLIISGVALMGYAMVRIVMRTRGTERTS